MYSICTMGERGVRILIKSFVLIVLLVGDLCSSMAPSQCKLVNGECTYNIKLSPAGSCSNTNPTGSQQTDAFINYGLKPEELRQVEGEKMNQVQQDVNQMQENFDIVKDDHESRLRELEISIQKLLRNSIPSSYVGHQSPRTGAVHDNTDRGTTAHSGVQSPPERSGNLLLFQLQSQFGRMTTTLSERTADLLDARNKLNETLELLTAAQKQSLDSSGKLAGLETKASVLGRQTNILKNKLKDKTERLEYATEQLNTSSSKLVSIETQLYDVVRSEATIKEELETLKIVLNRTQTELTSLHKNHTELTAKFKRVKKTLNLREEELMECYSAKTQSFCGFEDPDLCGFTQENGSDLFNWQLLQGRTPSSNTGPEYDHTCNSRQGHFMYIEASGKAKGNKARMRSPKYRGLSAQCVEFFYHMHGKHVGTLAVFNKLLTSDELRAIWRVFGNQGNIWIKASVSISEETARSGYQLIFEATVEQGYLGDIAFDDFRIRDGRCAADETSAEITPPPLKEKERSKLLQDQIERYRKILRKRQRMRERVKHITSEERTNT